MNFAKLLEPYSEPQQDGRPLRTPEGQIRWLQKKGLARDIIDKAFLMLFSELEQGKTFENGNKLDQYLLNLAQALHEAEASKQVKELEVFMNTFKQQAVEEYVKVQKGSMWKRVKAVFKPV